MLILFLYIIKFLKIFIGYKIKYMETKYCLRDTYDNNLL